MRAALGMTAGGISVVSTILAAGWIGVILFLGITVTVIAALCWIVNDPDRVCRLALLCLAWRGKLGPPSRGPGRCRKDNA